MVPQRLFCWETAIPTPGAHGIARMGPSVVRGIGYAAFEGPGRWPGEYEYLQASRIQKRRGRTINTTSGRTASLDLTRSRLSETAFATVRLATLAADRGAKQCDGKLRQLRGISADTGLWSPAKRSMMLRHTGHGQMSFSLAQQFEANLPGLSKPIRITTQHDAEVFTCRWAIRDKDPALKVLLREMQRANSSKTATTAILRLKQALTSRGLLGRVGFD